jgi:hypothetical protein
MAGLLHPVLEGTLVADGRVHWNKKDDAVLLKLKKAGDAVSAIARKMGRTHSAVTSRTAHLRRQERLARLLDERRRVGS